jgi:hypothetical protein
MFKSLKKALGIGQEKEAPPPSTMLQEREPEPPADISQLNKISEWASGQGLSFSEQSSGYSVTGKVHGRPWKLEQGRPSRDFIRGLELRARGEMALNEDVALMIMTRSLKNELDKRAFALYTDTLQTQVDPHLPEELRWLSMYDEVGWEGLGEAFLNDYAILADTVDNARAWITPDLVRPLLAWPSSEPDVPRVLMLLRGKVYLRMQIAPADILTLEHASRVFSAACEAGVAAFATDISI